MKGIDKSTLGPHHNACLLAKAADLTLHDFKLVMTCNAPPPQC